MGKKNLENESTTQNMHKASGRLLCYDEIWRKVEHQNKKYDITFRYIVKSANMWGVKKISKRVDHPKYA